MINYVRLLEEEKIKLFVCVLQQQQQQQHTKNDNKKRRSRQTHTQKYLSTYEAW
jgi:hypothetical protein